MNGSFFETDLMGIILLSLLFFYSRKIQKGHQASLMLNRVIFYTIISMISDVVYYYIDGVMLPGMVLLNYIDMIVYFTAAVMAAYYWFGYTYCELYKGNYWGGKHKLHYALPMLTVVIMVLASPFTHWIFYINEHNVYVRGSLYIIQPILTYSYIICGGIISFIMYKREILAEQKKHCLNLCIYTFLPIVGGILQVVFFGMNTVMPAIVISIVMIYLDDIKQEVARDALTKLNNRGQFDRYLEQKTKNVGGSDLYLIFFDIDNFKHINDTYGHVEGDRAIVVIADALKTVFPDTRSFAARYGGDEFAVVTNDNREDVIKRIGNINSLLKNESADMQFELSLSMGYARYGDNGINTIEELIRAADKNMYADKQDKKVGKL